ncbi:unnamed protein product, partial [Nezara viridula]
MYNYRTIALGTLEETAWKAGKQAGGLNQQRGNRAAEICRSNEQRGNTAECRKLERNVKTGRGGAGQRWKLCLKTNLKPCLTPDPLNDLFRSITNNLETSLTPI